MTLSVVDTIRVLRALVFPFQNMTEEQKTEQEVAFQRTCGSLHPDIFERAVIEAMKDLRGTMWLKPGNVISQAKLLTSADATTRGQASARPMSDIENQAWCLREINHLSPRACKGLLREIEAKETLLQKVKPNGVGWDGQIVAALMSRAALAVDEPEPAPAPPPAPSKPSPVKPLAKAIQAVKDDLVDYTPGGP